MKINLYGSQPRCLEEFSFSNPRGPLQQTPSAPGRGQAPTLHHVNAVVRKESSSHVRKWSEQSFLTGLSTAPLLARPPRRDWVTESVLRKILCVRPGTSCSQAHSLVHGAQGFMQRLE